MNDTADEYKIPLGEKANRDDIICKMQFSFTILKFKQALNDRKIDIFINKYP
jgi:hypothetical protein